MPAHKKPDELALATDAFTRAVGALMPPEEVAAFAAALSDLIAVLASGAVAKFYERTERRLDSQSDRIIELARSLDAAKDSLGRDMTVLAELLPPLDALYKLSVKVEALERQVGGHASDTT